MWNRREFTAAGIAALSAPLSAEAANASSTKVAIDLRREAGPLPHIWSRCVGSDRAAVTLREEWRRDLSRFRTEAGVERVRFHGILADELGVWVAGRVPNFQNVDAVYDGLLERGVQPFVELSFMPRKLASANKKLAFTYNANISPPASMQAWGDFVGVFVAHLIDRYGINEVRQWYFEVWNEPDLSFFWAGEQADYFALYKAAALAIKQVDREVRVGGPSTSATRWIDMFLAFCAQNDLPVDFVSTHLYAGDDQKLIFGRDRKLAQNDVIPAAMAHVRQQIDSTRYKGAQLWLSEWSSDSPAMIAYVITQCLPHCHAMSQWALSSAFEEMNVPDFILKEGDNGWGMMAQRGIVKPQFNTYKLLHKMGDRRLKASGPVLASRTASGAAALIWNLADVQQPSGIPGMSSKRKVIGAAQTFDVQVRGAKAGQSISVSYVDMERGSPFPAWRRLGSPLYPTRSQIEEIRAAAEIPPPQKLMLGHDGRVSLTLPAEGVALIEIV